MADTMPAPNGYIDRVEYAVEVDFFVAQAKHDYHYPVPEDGSRDRYACPAGMPFPVGQCIVHCTDLLARNTRLFTEPGIGVARPRISIRGDEPNIIFVKHGWLHEGRPPRECVWFVSPSTRALPTSESPEEYNWIPLTLRSPYIPMDISLAKPTTSPADIKTPIELALGVLRAGTKMHANSTCEIRIFMSHQEMGGLKMREVQRVVSLWWVQEPELFLALRPKGLDCHPTTEVSRIARLPSAFAPGVDYSTISEAQRKDCLSVSKPASKGDIKRNVPEFINPLLQERIQHIWCVTSLPQMSALISNNDGAQEKTFVLHAPPGRLPSFEFRYGVWHPQRESLSFWVTLVGGMFSLAVGIQPEDFREMLRVTQQSAVDVLKHDKKERWKTMMTQGGVSNLQSFHWDALVREYEEGGELAPETLDCQGVLEPLEGVDYASEDEYELVLVQGE